MNKLIKSILKVIIIGFLLGFLALRICTIFGINKTYAYYVPVIVGLVIVLKDWSKK